MLPINKNGQWNDEPFHQLVEDDEKGQAAFREMLLKLRH
jgi:hypothetical protein